MVWQLPTRKVGEEDLQKMKMVMEKPMESFEEDSYQVHFELVAAHEHSCDAEVDSMQGQEKIWVLAGLFADVAKEQVWDVQVVQQEGKNDNVYYPF